MLRRGVGSSWYGRQVVMVCSDVGKVVCKMIESRCYALAWLASVPVLAVLSHLCLIRMQACCSRVLMYCAIPGSL